MSWKGKRVVVTGAGGFIGSHLTERLVEAGAVTRAFVHYHAVEAAGWLARSPCRRDIEIVGGDICDRDSVLRALRGTDVVFHLAALIAIPYSYHAPLSYVRTNAEGTAHVLQACRDLGVERMVHTSTSEVYGTSRYVPMDESHPLQAQSPYAASKIAADKLAESFFLSFGVPVVTVRPFNTFGPRQSARAIVPTIITQCLVGDRVRLGNVSPTRDLNFVADTAEAFLRAAEAPGIAGRTINVGSGRETAIDELVELVAGIVGKNVTIVRDGERVRPEASEVERLVADSGLAKTLLPWTPAVGLEEGLRRTVAWVADNLDRYQPGVYEI